MCKNSLIYCGYEVGLNNTPLVIEMNTYWTKCKLQQDWTAVWRRDNGQKRWITIPSGERFVSDGASVPKAFTWYAPKFGMWTPAAVVHDWLYHEHKWKREDADKCFYDMMLQLHVKPSKAWVMYKAVRMFGGLFYGS